MSIRTSYERYLERIDIYFACAGVLERDVAEMKRRLRDEESRLLSEKRQRERELADSKGHLEKAFRNASMRLSESGLRGRACLPDKVTSIPSDESLQDISARQKDLYKDLDNLIESYKEALAKQPEKKGCLSVITGLFFGGAGSLAVLLIALIGRT